MFYQDVLLEKRFKGNLSLVNRIAIYPNDKVVLSTYAIQGDISIRGRYIYVVFTDNVIASNPTYYIQKRLKSNFALVSQFETDKRIFSVLGDPFAHNPSIRTEKINLGTEGRYIQLKFYDSGSDNRIKFIRQTFVVSEQPLKY